MYPGSRPRQRPEGPFRGRTAPAGKGPHRFRRGARRTAVVSNPERRILPGPVGPQDVSFGPCSGTACAVKLVKNHAHAGLGGRRHRPWWHLGRGRAGLSRPAPAGPRGAGPVSAQPSPNSPRRRGHTSGTSTTGPAASRTAACATAPSRGPVAAGRRRWPSTVRHDCRAAATTAPAGDSGAGPAGRTRMTGKSACPRTGGAQQEAGRGAQAVGAEGEEFP